MVRVVADLPSQFVSIFPVSGSSHKCFTVRETEVVGCQFHSGGISSLCESWFVVFASYCRCKPDIPKQTSNLTEGTNTQTSLGSSRTSPSNLKTQSQLPNPRPVLHPRYVGQGHSALYVKRSVIKGPTFHGFAIVALSNPSVFTTNNWLL